MARRDGLETLAQLLVADGGFDKLEVGSSGLQIGPQEAGMMAEPRRVDADPDRERRQRMIRWRRNRGWLETVHGRSGARAPRSKA